MISRGKEEEHESNTHANIDNLSIESDQTKQNDEKENASLICQFCLLQISPSEPNSSASSLLEHEDYCGSRTNQCPICNSFVRLKEMNFHLETNCLGEESRRETDSSHFICPLCEESVILSTIEEHQLNCGMVLCQEEEEEEDIELKQIEDELAQIREEKQKKITKRMKKQAKKLR
eukprot:TRINITY_DN380_c0_g1_i1.p1 TRINITY_DN380_c0_g1~~TRINITY_DN380_c0_g1_i1.p1  ORF type:complete len:176 (+),score=57.22 TRINITY_DN380_c0_g1_i1:445-972(+)